MADRKILIVDDDPAYRRLLGEILQHEGYAVAEAATGEAGLESAVEQAPDVVLLDLGLPDLDGSRVLDRLMKLRPSARVIVITGQGSIATAVEAMKRGARDFSPSRRSSGN